MMKCAFLLIMVFLAPCEAFVTRTTRTWRRAVAQGVPDDLEAQAVAAAEAWDEQATGFLDGPLASKIADRLASRADVGCVVAGGYDGATRCRLVFTNPELVDATDASGYARLLRLDADDAGDVAMYNVLTEIGLTFDQLGDVLVDGNSAYVVVDPAAMKTLERLLPKALSGVVTIEAADGMPQGNLEVAEIKRLDTRSQNRR